MFDIVHRVGMRASVSQVYESLASVEGVAGWWAREMSGVSEVGHVLQACFRSPSGEILGEMKMEVVALVPNRKVHWRFVSGPEEWIGTDAVFDLSQQGDYAIVVFGHRNWRQPVEFMAHCSMKWATFLLSLKDLVETGQGRPSPDDIKIDNWN